MKFIGMIQDIITGIGVAMQLIPYFEETSPMFNAWTLILVLLIIRIEISIQQRPTTVCNNKSKNNRSRHHNEDDEDLPKLSCQVSNMCCGNNDPDKIRILRHALVFRSKFYPSMSPTADDTPNDDAKLIALFQYCSEITPQTKFRGNNSGQDTYDDHDNQRTNRENNNNNNNPWVFFKFIVAWCFSPLPEQDGEELMYYDLLVHCAVATIWLFQTTPMTRRKYGNSTSSSNSCCGCGFVSVGVLQVWIEELVLHSKLGAPTPKNADSIEIDAYRRCARRILEYLQLIGLVGPEEEEEEEKVAEPKVDNSNIPTAKHTHTHYCQLKWDPSVPLMNYPNTLQNQKPQQQSYTKNVFDLDDDGIVIHDSSGRSIENWWRHCWIQRLEKELEKVWTNPKPHLQTGLSRCIYTNLPHLCTQNRSYVKSRRLLENPVFCQGRLATLGVRNGIQQHVKDCEQLVEWMEQGLMILGGSRFTTHSTNDGGSSNSSKNRNESIYSAMARCLHKQKATKPLDVIGNAYYNLGMSYIRLGDRVHDGGTGLEQNDDATATVALEMFEHADSIQQKVLEEWCCLQHLKGCSSIAQSLFNLSLVYKARKEKEQEDMCTQAELKFVEYCHSSLPNSSKNKSEQEHVLRMLLKAIQTACHVYNEFTKHNNHQKENNGLSLYYDALCHTMQKASHICWLKVQILLSIYNICADPRYLKEIVILLDIVEVVGTTAAKCRGYDVKTKIEDNTVLTTLESSRDLAKRIQRLLQHR